VSIARSIRSYLNSKVARRGLAALTIGLAASRIASAEPLVFVEQPGAGGVHYHGVSDPTIHGAWQGVPGPTPMVLPEITPPGKRPSFAGNVTIGNFNNTGQVQLGRHDRSLIGILGGNHDTVNVLQNGNNLQSDIVLINPPPGLNMTFVQQPNSLPLDLLIARLANGQWLVKK
jgi:hypothetical protein